MAVGSGLGGSAGSFHAYLQSQFGAKANSELTMGKESLNLWREKLCTLFSGVLSLEFAVNGFSAAYSRATMYSSKTLGNSSPNVKNPRNSQARVSAGKLLHAHEEILSLLNSEDLTSEVDRSGVVRI
jgi:hypothetical protein